MVPLAAKRHVVLVMITGTFTGTTEVLSSILTQLKPLLMSVGIIQTKPRLYIILELFIENMGTLRQLLISLPMQLQVIILATISTS